MNVRKSVYLAIRKSVKGVVNDYRVRLSQIVTDNLNGNIDAQTQTRRHKALLIESAEDVYLEGLKEAKLPQVLDKHDKDRIARFLKEESKYVYGFALDTLSARQTGGVAGFDPQLQSVQTSILSRVDMWASAIDVLGALARVKGRDDVLVIWSLGPTEQHCLNDGELHGCAALALNEPRPLSYYIDNDILPRRNGSKTLKCGGWKCLCYLKDAKTGKRVF